MVSDSDHQFVFVTGLHRSGTSVLHRCLRLHPLVSGFRNTGVTEDEGQHLQSVLPRGGEFGGPGRFAMHPNAHMTESHPCANPQTAAKLFDEWRPHWDLNKPILIEKTPITIVRTRLIQALFPKSTFIVIVRHPIPVALATYNVYASQGVHELTIAGLVENWIAAHETLRADARYLRRLHVLKYECLVRDPQAEHDAIYAFLNVPSHSLAERVNANANDRYWEEWRSITKDPRYRKDFEATMSLEDRVRIYGYSIEDESRRDAIDLSSAVHD